MGCVIFFVAISRVSLEFTVVGYCLQRMHTEVDDRLFLHMPYRLYTPYLHVPLDEICTVPSLR